MPLSIPVTFVANTDANAADVNANFQAVANKFTTGTSGIVDADIATSAAISGSKLSNVAGNRVPADRIENGAIIAGKFGPAAIQTADIAPGAVANATMGFSNFTTADLHGLFGGSWPAFQSATFTIGTSIQPIVAYLSRADATVYALIATFALNSGTGSWTLIVQNATNATVNIAAGTFCVVKYLS